MCTWKVGIESVGIRRHRIIGLRPTPGSDGRLQTTLRLHDKASVEKKNLHKMAD